MIVRILPLIAALAWCAPAAAATDDVPGAYAVQVPITPAAGSSLQRLNLPARVLAATRSEALADVRVFNAQGRAMPIARAPAPRRIERRNVPLAVMPILGAADALAITGMSLKIDDRQRASVVRVDGTPLAGNAAKLLGVLLDTRAIAPPVSALLLDLATPAAQPVSFTVESSTDLAAWQTLTTQVIYRTTGQAAGATLAFPAQDLRGRYLRVTWKADSRLLSPVVVRSAAARTEASDLAQAPRAILKVPTMVDSRTIEFTVPFRTPIASLEILPAEDDVVVPLRVLGRDQREQPWTPIASGSVFRLTSNGSRRSSDALDLQGSRYRTLRIEADVRTGGFGTAPSIAVRFAPVQILFLASGPGPFTLAAGRVEAPDVFLPQNDLAQGRGLIPTATTPAEADPVVASLEADHGVRWQQLGLWAVLLGATALLAAMVWLLVRRREPTS